MRPTIIIVIVAWAVVLCIILGALIVSKAHKSSDKKSFSKEKKNSYPVRKDLPKSTSIVPEVSKPVEPEASKPVETLNPVEEPAVEEANDDKEDNNFQEEEEVEKVVQVVNGRKVFVQFNYSFRAKLILASKEVQQQYISLVNYVRSYGVKTSISWKQERIYLGRNTYAMLLFKGKKLCVSYALDPKEYEESKYHIIDLSEVKRFEKTPTLIKITSDRKLKYSYELLDIILGQNNLVKTEMEPENIDIPVMTKDELIEEKLIKVYTSEEITEGTVLEKANVADIIKKNVTINEAKQLITDDSAMEYLQVEVSNTKKTYTKKDIINIDTISKNFKEDDLVNLKTLKEKKLISPKVDYIKVLARGVLDKPLIIEAQDFSIDAIKMIIVTGGEVRKVI